MSIDAMRRWARGRRDDLPTFYGTTAVAEWLGVSRVAVYNWLQLHDDTPEPAGQIRGPERDVFFWREDQRADWERWACGKDATEARKCARMDCDQEFHSRYTDKVYCSERCRQIVRKRAARDAQRSRG